MKMSLDELIAHVRLLYSALGLVNSALGGQQITANEQYDFWFGYMELHKYRDLPNRKNGGLVLLIQELDRRKNAGVEYVEF